MDPSHEHRPLISIKSEKNGDVPLNGNERDSLAAQLSVSINLSACAFGASMLALPYSLELVGPLLALFILCVMCWLAAQSALSLVRVGIKCGGSARVVAVFLGHRMEALYQAIVSLCLVSAALSYIVGLAELLPALCPAFFSPVGASAASSGSHTSHVLLVMVLISPLTLVPSLGDFGPTSVLACTGCYLQAFALLVKAATSTSSNTPNTPFTPTGSASPAPSAVGSVQTPWLKFAPQHVLVILPLMTFLFAYHYVLQDSLAELNRESVAGTTKILRHTSLTLMGCYLLVGVCGYVIFGGVNVPGNVLPTLTGASAVIAQWAIAALLFLTYPLFLIPLRKRVQALLFDYHVPEDPHRTAPLGVRFRAALLLAVLVGIAALALPDLMVANQVAGACVALVMFAFPGLVELALARSRLSTDVSCMMGYVRGGTFLCLGLTVALLGLAQAFGL
eukprot:g19026.t1